MTFQSRNDETPQTFIGMVGSGLSWVLLVVKMGYCLLVPMVLLLNLTIGKVSNPVLQGLAPTHEDNSLSQTIIYIYYANYARWTVFTLGPRLFQMRLQRYHDLLLKIPNLKDTIKNIILFICSDLMNFNMINAALILLGSKQPADSVGDAGPAAFLLLQYLSPPHMIKARFEPHVKEHVVKPSMLSYDCVLCPFSPYDYGKVVAADVLLNWINFYLWVCYWIFLVIGLIYVGPTIAFCGYICTWVRKVHVSIRYLVYSVVVGPLLSSSVLFCLLGEVLSGAAFSLLFTMIVLLLEHDLIESSILTTYFPDFDRRLQPAGSTSMSIDSRIPSLQASLLP